MNEAINNVEQADHPFIECNQLVRIYKVGDHEIVALRGVKFAMSEGEIIAIVGASGSGKSTLLHLIGGLDTPTGGSINVNGQWLNTMSAAELARYRLHKVGFVWQNIESNLFPHLTVYDNLTLPLKLAGVPKHEHQNRVDELLTSVGLRDNIWHRAIELSGGQQQRIALALALANRPPLLLADEPTGALDYTTSMQIMEYIHSLRERYKLTILIVTHDPQVAQIADRVLTLREGNLSQNIADEDDETVSIDEQGRVRLPKIAYDYLSHTDALMIEIHHDGVLVRPQMTRSDKSSQQATYAKRDQAAHPLRWRRLLGRKS